MTSYVGLDVSLKSTSICVVDAAGSIMIEQSVPSEPDAITNFINTKATEVQRVGLESCPTSVWLWRELAQRGLPVICIDARHTKAALSMQINKSDRNDAVGIARLYWRAIKINQTVTVLCGSRFLLLKIRTGTLQELAPCPER